MRTGGSGSNQERGEWNERADEVCFHQGTLRGGEARRLAQASGTQGSED